jgi:hypothetical protein
MLEKIKEFLKNIPAFKEANTVKPEVTAPQNKFG